MSSPRPRLDAASGSSRSGIERDRLGRFDDRVAARQLEPARAARPAERVRHLHLAPAAAERGVQRVERSLSPVRDGQLVDIGPRRKPFGERVAAAAAQTGRL